MTQEYVCGFAFNADLTQVAVIRKLRPTWQAGKLNGIGGKIEPTDKTHYQAMEREFQEETGVRIMAHDWKSFCTYSGYETRDTNRTENRFVVHFFCCAGVDLETLQTTTDEQVCRIQVDELSFENTVPNLQWLIPLALQRLKHPFESIVVY